MSIYLTPDQTKQPFPYTERYNQTIMPYHIFFTKGRNPTPFKSENSYIERETAITRAGEMLDMFNAMGVKNVKAIVTQDEQYSTESTNTVALVLQNQYPTIETD